MSWPLPSLYSAYTHGNATVVFLYGRLLVVESFFNIIEVSVWSPVCLMRYSVVSLLTFQ